MSDNMTINRLRFGFHRSDNRFQNSIPVLALLFGINGLISITGCADEIYVISPCRPI